MKKKILAISGSVRKASINTAILQHIKESYKADFLIEIYDKVDQLPIFNPDLTDELLPPIIRALQTKIATVDGVIISTPEYVFSLPGNLKNLLEWNVATTVFAQKPTAIIIAAASGQKAFASLDLVMSTITCAPIPPELKLLLQGIGKKVDVNGQLNDMEVIEQISQLMMAFIITLNKK